MKKRLIVIGGGAAGFFCAINAAALAPGLQVLILERTSKVLSKVRISGGGRCNVTHECFSISSMIKNYPRGSIFLKKAFTHFFTPDTIRWFLERGVPLKTESDGRMFPMSNTSETIVDCLLKEAHKYKVQIVMNMHVTGINFSKSDKGRQSNNFSEVLTSPFSVSLSNGDTLPADFLCIACGGFPKKDQFDWLHNLLHTFSDPVPSLFTFNIPNKQLTSLMGVSIGKVKVSLSGTKLFAVGPLLITHWGLSGPAVLRLSAFAANELAKKNYIYKVIINWLPEFNENTLREEVIRQRHKMARKRIHNSNPFQLPQRLWNYFLEQIGIGEEMRWADFPAKLQNLLISLLCSQQFEVKGKTTFKEEFVTAGGVTLCEIDPNTMQSLIRPNVYFAGEIMDIDGVTGGFNFQHAWTSGYIAGRAIANSAGK